MPASKQPTINVVFALFPGVTHLDFTGPHQVLCMLPGAKVTVASAGGRDIDADGVRFANLADLTKLQDCDVLCIPGGFGTTAAMLDEDFMAAIRRLGSRARYVTSVCTGSLILAAAGLLTGKRAGCHWAWRDHLAAFGVTPDPGRVVRDGNTFTAGGVTSGIDFGLTLVAEIAGAETAQAIQLILEYAPAPPFNSGRPELASPAVMAKVAERYGKNQDQRAAQIATAADRLKQRTAA